jgi:hypothetical protein
MGRTVFRAAFLFLRRPPIGQADAIPVSMAINKEPQQ